MEMRRFVDFFSEELKRTVRIPIDIKVERDESRNMLRVEIPQQTFDVAEEATYFPAIWK